MTNTYTDRAGRDVESITIELDDGEKIEFNSYALDAGAEVNPQDHWVFVTHTDGRHIAYPLHRIRSIRMLIAPRQNIGETLLAAERLHMTPDTLARVPHTNMGEPCAPGHPDECSYCAKAEEGPKWIACG